MGVGGTSHQRLVNSRVEEGVEGLSRELLDLLVKVVTVIAAGIAIVKALTSDE